MCDDRIEGLSHEEAVSVLKATPKIVKLKIEKGVLHKKSQSQSPERVNTEIQVGAECTLSCIALVYYVHCTLYPVCKCYNVHAYACTCTVYNIHALITELFECDSFVIEQFLKF